MKTLLENLKKMSPCKRHAVSAALFVPGQSEVIIGWNFSKNCTGEVGGCGCTHAEMMCLGAWGYRLWAKIEICEVCLADIEQACRRQMSIMWTSLSPCSFCLDEIVLMNRVTPFPIGVIIFSEVSRHGLIDRSPIRQIESECKCQVRRRA